MNFALVFLGGGGGAFLRYSIGLALKPYFPWTTLLINVLGSVALGFIAALGRDKPHLQLLLCVGVCGGFTTFSAFSVKVVQLLEGKQYLIASVYVGGSVLAGVGGAWLAMRGAAPIEL